MQLEDDFLKSEIKLRREYDRFKKLKPGGDKKIGQFGRCFHFYELYREIIKHWADFDESMILKSVFLPGNTPEKTMAGSLLFDAVYLHIADLGNDFAPWIKLTDDQKNEFIRRFNGPIESLNNARRLDVYDITDQMMRADRNTWEEFERVFKSKSGQVWLIAQFDPDDINNWSRQFDAWREKQAKRLKTRTGNASTSSLENIGDWLDQISRLRLLRKVNWIVEATDQIDKVARLKPDRKKLWQKNVQQVEAHCKKFFDFNVKFEPAEKT